MAFRETSDEDLMFEIIQNDKVILKYHTDSYGDVCEQLKNVFQELSDNKDYEGITFLRINADNNPIAKKTVDDKKLPIMNIYYKGKLVECRTIETKDIKDLLDKLSGQK